VYVVFWALLLWQANTILILFWTQLGYAENFFITPRSWRSVSLRVMWRLSCWQLIRESIESHRAGDWEHLTAGCLPYWASVTFTEQIVCYCWSTVSFHSWQLQHVWTRLLVAWVLGFITTKHKIMPVSVLVCLSVCLSLSLCVCVFLSVCISLCLPVSV